jgi:hypothetical protein
VTPVDDAYIPLYAGAEALIRERSTAVTIDLEKLAIIAASQPRTANA